MIPRHVESASYDDFESQSVEDEFELTVLFTQQDIRKMYADVQMHRMLTSRRR